MLFWLPSPLSLFWLPSGSRIRSVFLSYPAQLRHPLPRNCWLSRIFLGFRNGIRCTSNRLSYWAAISSLNTSRRPNRAYFWETLAMPSRLRGWYHSYSNENTNNQRSVNSKGKILPLLNYYLVGLNMYTQQVVICVWARPLIYAWFEQSSPTYA